MRRNKKQKVAYVNRRFKTHNISVSPDDIQYVIELANKHPRWTVDRIFTQVIKPRSRSCVVLALSPGMKCSLDEKSKEYRMNINELVQEIVLKWLDDE